MWELVKARVFSRLGMVVGVNDGVCGMQWWTTKLICKEGCFPVVIKVGAVIYPKIRICLIGILFGS